MVDSAKEKVAIHFLIDRDKLDLIDRATTLLGVGRTNFIMSAACEKAEKIILDTPAIHINSSAFNAFEAALEANPIANNEALNVLMSRPKRFT